MNQVNKNKEVKIPVTIRLEPSLVERMRAFGASRKWNLSETIRQATISFDNSGGEMIGSRETSFAEAMYTALVKEVESGKLFFLEDPKTQEKMRVLVPIQESK